MSEIVFEELPPDRRGPTGQGVMTGAYSRISRALRGRPGEWARVASYINKGTAAGMATKFRCGGANSFRPAGSFEATVRTVGAENRVYARYIGEGDPDV